MTLTATDIQVGKTYRAKRPATVNLAGDKNDRTVLWISGTRERVQYDGPAVALGRHYPTVDMEVFVKWAGHEVGGEPCQDSQRFKSTSSAS